MYRILSCDPGTGLAKMHVQTMHYGVLGIQKAMTCNLEIENIEYTVTQRDPLIHYWAFGRY